MDREEKRRAATKSQWGEASDFHATGSPDTDPLDRQLSELFEAAAASRFPADARQIEAIKSPLVGSLRPVRPFLPPAIVAGAFLFIFALLSALSMHFLKSYGWDVLMPFQRITIFTTLAGAAALLAFSLAPQMIPGSQIRVRPGLLIIGLPVLLCLVAASIFQVRAEPNFLRDGEACVQAGLPFSVPAALLFAWILRRGTLLSPRRTAALTGMLSGLVSTSVLEIHCPNLNMWHIMVWHFGFPLAGAGMGLLLGAAGEKIRRLFT